jgi:5-methylcytosine-specific restriction endonuclease McrA
LGKIKRKALLAKEIWTVKPHLVCALCEREIPKDQLEAHHLIPKSKGGTQTEYMHSICHRQIHALFKETELASVFNTADALLAHPEFAKFIAWVKTKPIGFKKRSRKSERLR